jgi:hypothetical protein
MQMLQTRQRIPNVMLITKGKKTLAIRKRHLKLRALDNWCILVPAGYQKGQVEAIE